MGKRWRHLANTTEPSICGGYAALCQMTLSTCSLNSEAVLAFRGSRPNGCDVVATWFNTMLPVIDYRLIKTYWDLSAEW